VMARMADAVVALEEDDGMATEAQRRLADAGADNAAVVSGPLAAGMPKHAPYDAIVIEGGVETVPEQLLAQLRDGGRIAALFMDGRLGTVRIGTMRDGRVTWRFGFNAAAPVLPGFARAKAFTL
ncbi:MAG TPA: protein-L-isoaspartate O-methyltransferase, partial [Paracoccaceae bacterium]|nr:protein-L-isoaspartate O-methyltransferase [Paracoccaceae bacterium]